MEFNSYLFILLFLPCTLLLYHICHLIHNELGKLCLIMASLQFAGYEDIRFVYVLLVEMVINFTFGLLIKKIKCESVTSVLVALGIILNVLYLGRVKYAYFLVGAWNSWFQTQFTVGKLLVPLGISFITFQQIAFLVDVKNKKIDRLRLSDYIFYILYFPKLIQGPITKYQELVPQIYKRKISSEDIACGLWFFANGLAQKVLLADVLAKAVNWGYDCLDELTSLEAILVMLFYTLQIYFDFNGYSHMAIGISKLFGISLPNNFDAPYRATSVDDFWKRWHISLTDFLREYLYFPLGGSRKGKVRTYINILVIFLVSGIWHGANWTFLVWGLVHGVSMCINRMLVRVSPWEGNNPVIRVIRWTLTFLYVNVTWVIFRAGSLEQAKLLFGRMLSFDQFGISEQMIENFDIPEFAYLIRRFSWVKEITEKIPSIELVVFTMICMLITLTIRDKWQQFKPSIWRSVSAIVLFLWSVISLSYVSEFIYEMF